MPRAERARLFLAGNVGLETPWISDVNSARKFEDYEEALNAAFSLPPNYQAKVFPPPTLLFSKA
jgi:hypothetical protein